MAKVALEDLARLIARGFAELETEPRITLAARHLHHAGKGKTTWRMAEENKHIRQTALHAAVRLQHADSHRPWLVLQTRSEHKRRVDLSRQHLGQLFLQPLKPNPE